MEAAFAAWNEGQHAPASPKPVVEEPLVPVV